MEWRNEEFDLGGVNHLALVCSDMKRTVEFYTQVLGMRLIKTINLPGGAGGWFCHTPAVPVARVIGRKRLMQLALTGEPIDARTALEWGMVNAVVPDEQLDAEVDDLLARATRGSPTSKALGKRTLYAQLDRPEADAYDIAIPVMAATAQSPAAREGRAAFLGKRPPSWPE